MIEKGLNSQESDNLPNHRYSGEPLRLYDFMYECIVCCPKCEADAVVNIPWFSDVNNASLKCFRCHFTEDMGSRKRYRLPAIATCHVCSSKLTPSMDNFKKIPPYIKQICGQCKAENTIKENWESYHLKYNEQGINDPAFGLPLWLIESVKGNILWAFNYKHLAEIKNYVKANLRERTTDKFKMTMVEKLPEFITSHKNRNLDLKSIQKMELK